MRRTLLSLLLLCLPTSALAQGMDVVYRDRMCNANLRDGNGINSYLNGMCITSVTRNSDGLGDDLVCWHSVIGNQLITAWMGGDDDTGQYAAPNYDFNVTDCEDTLFGFSSSDTFQILVNQVAAGNQAPSIVFDAGAASNLGSDEPEACDCACPIPPTRDGVNAGPALWTLSANYQGYAGNKKFYVFGGNDGDELRTVRTTPIGAGSTPGIYFFGGVGNDTLISYGRSSDRYEDTNYLNGSVQTGDDTMWCGALENGSSPWLASCRDIYTLGGNDNLWINSNTAKISSMTWDLGPFDTDQTTTHAAPYTTQEDSLVALPAMPACPAWIQPAVANGRYPGMQ